MEDFKWSSKVVYGVECKMLKDLENISEVIIAWCITLCRLKKKKSNDLQKS